MADYKEVTHERLYVRIPGTDKLRRTATARLKHLLEQADADPATVAQLADVVDHLDELFLVVVVGEFNAGKSSVLKRRRH